MYQETPVSVMDEKSSDIKEPVDIAFDEATEGTSELLYIDPKKEAACRKKFDKYVVPVSVIFLVLSTLDRNNVSGAFGTLSHQH
jgi:hypothetical protein